MRHAPLQPMIQMPQNPERKSVSDLVGFYNGLAAGNSSTSNSTLTSSSAPSIVAESNTDKMEAATARPSIPSRVETAVGPMPQAPATREIGTMTDPEPVVTTEVAANTDAPVENDAVVTSDATVNTEAVVTTDAEINTEAVATTDTAVATDTAVEKVEKSEQPDPENLPLQGWVGLKNAIVGPNGIVAGVKALGKGKAAEGLSNIVRSVISAPIHAAAAILDGPRKLADVAAIKGQALVKSGEEQGGILGALKAFAGGLVQVLGGVARLAKPILGLALIAAGGPAGWIAGLILLGLFAFKEVNCVINDKVDEMQLLKVVRDIGSGAGAIVGSVISPATQAIAKRLS